MVYVLGAKDCVKHGARIISSDSNTFVIGRWTPSQGWRVGSCLTLRNEVSETHVLTRQKTLLGRGTQAESSSVREPRRTALPCGSQSQVLW